VPLVFDFLLSEDALHLRCSAFFLPAAFACVFRFAAGDVLARWCD
jgi:hypothetical protein